MFKVTEITRVKLPVIVRVPEVNPQYRPVTETVIVLDPKAIVPIPPRLRFMVIELEKVKVKVDETVMVPAPTKVPPNDHVTDAPTVIVYPKRTCMVPEPAITAVEAETDQVVTMVTVIDMVMVPVIVIVPDTMPFPDKVILSEELEELSVPRTVEVPAMVIIALFSNRVEPASIDRSPATVTVTPPCIVRVALLETLRSLKAVAW